MPIKNGGRRKTKRYELIVSRLLDDMLFVFGGIALILWSKNRSKKHPYAGYRQEVSWIDVVAAKKGFELAKEI